MARSFSAASSTTLPCSFASSGAASRSLMLVANELCSVVILIRTSLAAFRSTVVASVAFAFSCLT
eukprot:945707-Pleurochrysis_carterae.AAC.1